MTLASYQFTTTSFFFGQVFPPLMKHACAFASESFHSDFNHILGMGTVRAIPKLKRQVNGTSATYPTKVS